MGKVFIAGVGFTKIAEHWDRSLDGLLVEASLKAFDNAGLSEVDSIYVGNALAEALQDQMHLGAAVAEDLGLARVPAFRVEAAEASGAAALYAGFNEVASGRADAVLVVGGEKLSDGLPEEVSSGLMMGGRPYYESFIGADFYSLNALLYRIYCERYGCNNLASFPVMSHAHAEGVAHAQYPFKLSLEKVLSSPFIAEPLRRLEVSGIGDGAAAVILVGERLAGKLKSPLSQLQVASATDRLNPFDRESPLRFQSVGLAVSLVLRDARLSRNEIGFIELYDATSIMAALCLESSGFADPGKSGELAARGELDLGGSLPCNTFGGLKARGHPLGATALYQIAEAHLQVTDQAGRNQVDSAGAGLAIAIGGVGATAFASIVKRV